MLRHISISLRIVLLAAMALTMIAAMALAMRHGMGQASSIAATQLQQRMLEGHKERIKTATHSLAAALGPLVAAAADDPARQEAVRAALKPIRFEDDKSGYFFAYRGTVNVAHPLKPEFQGTDRSATKDKAGKAYIAELRGLAQAGGGFTTYIFEKPGAGDMEKLAYAELIPGTDIWLSTAVYTDTIAAARDAVLGEVQGEVRAQMRRILLAVGAVLALIMLPACALIARSIIRPLAATAAAAESMAAGNLGIRLSAAGRDELTRLEAALNTMAGSLHATFQGLEAEQAKARELAARAEGHAAEAHAAMERAETARRQGLRDAAGRLEGVIAALSADTRHIQGLTRQSQDAAGRQSSLMADTSSAMGQMNATVLDVARSTAEAAQHAAASRAKAAEGRQAVDQSIQAVAELRAKTEALKSAMGSLDGRAQAIGQVMTVISDIADQTNLLALNAAIEAARAGDAGRGFAVVADEVRKLAEKTMAATKEVGATIQAIQDDTRRNREAMHEADAAIAAVSGSAAASGDSLGQIVGLLDNAAGQVQSIAAAAEEQSAASEEISRSMEDATDLARQTADGVLQAAQLVEGLAEQSNTLGLLLADLKRESA